MSKMKKTEITYLDECTQYEEVYGELTFKIEKRWSFETEHSRFPTVASLHLYVNGKEMGHTGNADALFGYILGYKEAWGFKNKEDE